MARGWIDQPDGRGTFNLIWTCFVTVMLCSWSELFLNVPPVGKTRWYNFRTKPMWMILTIILPEVTAATAFEQYKAARQSVEDFKGLGYSQWTIRHAFFANIGGFHLEVPDKGFPSFPIDSQQLLYLVEEKYIPYPNIDERAIWDKNKASSFARVLTYIQITYFCLQLFERGIHHLPITPLEFLTLSFVFCGVLTLYSWRNKPLDAETPVVLRTERSLNSILVDAGNRVPKRYMTTPLDFVNPPHRFSTVRPFWFALQYSTGLGSPRTKIRPIEFFANSKTYPPRGTSVRLVVLELFCGVAYHCIHLASWNYHFPSSLERLLWHFTSLGLAVEVVVYSFFIVLVQLLAPRVFKREFNNVEEVLVVLPQWMQFVICDGAVGFYGVARIYMITACFMALRAVPLATYASVNWCDYLPHF